LAEVHGIDPWAAALKRAAEKIAIRRTPNVKLHEGSAAKLPFADETFDLIVSNCGLNNFDDRESVIRECARVSKPGATIALTTNLQGHMKEFYEAFASVVPDEAALRKHIEHRATVDGVRALLESGGFRVTRVIQRESVMRFAHGRALLNHYFIKLGFLEAWKDLAPREAFARLLEKMQGEVRLTIPMAYVEAVK
jgi:SAM-dependent methyltransferase